MSKLEQTVEELMSQVYADDGLSHDEAKNALKQALIAAEESGMRRAIKAVADADLPWIQLREALGAIDRAILQK